MTVLVLLPGAWHVPAHFEPLRSLLHAEGYETASRRLPSTSPIDAANLSLEHVVQYIRAELLSPLIEEQGKEVVVVMHSYSGVPGSASVEGFSLSERKAAGLKGGIIGLIYIATFMPSEGTSMLGLCGAELIPLSKSDPSKSSDFARYTNDSTCREVIDSSVFYNDLEPEEVKKWTSLLELQAVKPLADPVRYAAWQHNPPWDPKKHCRYVICSKDRANLTEWQWHMVETTGIALGDVLDSSHSPFLSQPKVLTDCIVKYCKQFQSAG